MITGCNYTSLYTGSCVGNGYGYGYSYGYDDDTPSGYAIIELQMRAAYCGVYGHGASHNQRGDGYRWLLFDNRDYSAKLKSEQLNEL